MSTLSQSQTGEPGTKTSESAAPRILIIKRSSLGDIVHAMPVACALRRTYPDAYIGWVVERRFEQVLHNHPALDEIIPVRRHRLHRVRETISDVLQIRRELLRRDLDWAIDLQGLFKSAFVQWFSGAPRRIGLEGHQRELSNLVVNEQVPAGDGSHAVRHYLKVARHLGADTEPLTFDIPVNPRPLQWARTLLEDSGMFDGRSIVGINPTTSMDYKNWDPDGFVRMANTIEDVNWVITGAPSDRSIAEHIADGIHAPSIATAGETDIARLVALISLMDLLVSCDSGPLHIAVALDVPTVALFGPTNPNLTGPLGDLHRTIWHRNPESDGTPGPELGTMEDITAAEVSEAVVHALSVDAQTTPQTP